jgi:phosphate transport system permease protein
VHLERSFMHLGFHIFDVGFQSRNSEAGKPMVFVTTLLLIALIAAMNLWAIIVRNRMKRKMAGSTF